jgi:hypothetical protein
MRTVLSVLLLAAALAVACAGCASTGSSAPASCREFGVRAIERQEVVRAMPSACAGLSQEQLNEAMTSAIHEVVGPRPKGIARKLALADGRYIASLVHSVPPGAPATLAGPSRPSPEGSGLGLAALACWLVTMAAGGYLLAGRRAAGKLPRVAIGHAALAVAGFAAWVAFAATSTVVLAWLAALCVATVAGMGMATLLAPALGGRPIGADLTTPGGRPPVLAIVGHGMLAVLTMLLVLLAATGRS